MIARLYRYSIPQEARNEWERITKETTACYRTHGMARASVVIAETGNKLRVTEINYYTTRKEMERVMRLVDADSRISELFKAFLSIVPRDKIREEICEVVE